MNSKVLTTPLKILSCGAFLLALGACSGHKFGDPAEKYGNLNQIAKDTEVKDVERPLAVGTNPVRIDAAVDLHSTKRA